MTDVPSSRVVAVQLAPTEGMSPVVCVAESAAEAFPRALREQLFSHFEKRLPPQADELIEGSSYHGKKNPRSLMMIKFAAGTKPFEALRIINQMVLWFFEDLAPRAYRRTARVLKQLRKKQKRQERRNEGRHLCRHPLYAR